ncbi:DUF1648 domain-containing protein [Geoglobus acetivorans]|uniref:DUF1648 domain-containing protein n=1 Tax=Geoglobus acetivorans TaxID=565033 RepID=A0ABZ3H623_GEOAI|nr:DUF1648 domain-containing protein [Geoglobus acetivorans]
MMKIQKIPPEPISKKGQIFLALILLGLAGIWVLAIYAYQTLPDNIPSHFNFEGKPDSYGDKSTWMILPVALSIAPIIFLLIAKYRFTIINNHPYLINLPAFFMMIDRIPAERRAWWVNRYFEVLLGMGAFLTLYLLAIEYGIYVGTVAGAMPEWFLPVTLGAIPVLIFGFLVFLKKLSAEIADEAKIYGNARA